MKTKRKLVYYQIERKRKNGNRWDTLRLYGVYPQKFSTVKELKDRFKSWKDNSMDYVYRFKRPNGPRLGKVRIVKKTELITVEHSREDLGCL